MEQLEHLLSAPSPENWDAICALLDEERDGKALEEMVALCEEGLEGWPDELRVAPEGWGEKNGKRSIARLHPESK